MKGMPVLLLACFLMMVSMGNAQQPQPGPTHEAAAAQCQQQLTSTKEQLQIAEDSIAQIHLPRYNNDTRSLVVMNQQLQKAQQRMQQLEQENLALKKAQAAVAVPEAGKPEPPVPTPAPPEAPKPPEG